MKRRYSVQELAKLAGVTVRALHHYDEVGLVVPGRARNGWRVYGEREVLLLQQVLLYRALGFGLDEIKRLMHAPGWELTQALEDQRRRLCDRLDQTRALIAAVDSALRAQQPGADMDPKNLFDGFDPEAHEQEASERWGDTDAFRESQRRTRAYKPQDWAAMRAESEAIYRELGQLVRSGSDPASAAVGVAVERHRAHIERWFYPCDLAFHAKLGELYVADPRFTANLDKHADGLSAFLRAATAARLGSA